MKKISENSGNNFKILDRCGIKTAQNIFLIKIIS